MILISCGKHTGPTYTVTRDTSMFLTQNQNHVFKIFLGGVTIRYDAFPYHYSSISHLLLSTAYITFSNLAIKMPQ